MRRPRHFTAAVVIVLGLLVGCRQKNPDWIGPADDAGDGNSGAAPGTTATGDGSETSAPTTVDDGTTAPLPCDQIGDEASCNANGGCVWVGVDCIDVNVDGCAQLPTEPACNAAAGCAWKEGACGPA